MEYERIERPSQGGGFSPGKLRSMLMGVEKRRREEEELELDSTFSLRSAVSQFNDRGGKGNSCLENCKDVDVVSVLPECSTAMASSGDFGLKDHSLDSSTIRFTEDCEGDYDGGQVLSLQFEFQKAERAPHRVPLAPFSKPAPSKWDDAQKWIASPPSNRPKAGPIHGTGLRKAAHLWNRQPSTKVILEVPDQKSVTFDEPDTKRIDLSQVKKDGSGQKLVSWVPDSCSVSESYGSPVLMIENNIGESAVSLSRHDSSVSIHSATTFVPPPSSARSVSMRDMGTEMTPITSQEPSRTGTPVRATTPTRSPTSSRPSTPTRAVPSSSPINRTKNHHDLNTNELSEKELQLKTRREIMILGTQLGKTNIAAWASKEEEDKDASTLLKTVAVEQPTKSVIETRAGAWEEAEKAKYMARYKREEIKIQAWENHQKAKTEAEMRKIEVEVERMRGRAQDRLMNKLAAARHKAEEKRAAAEARRNMQAAKTEQQAEYIRRTGHIPSSFSSCCCF
ncbi:Remorin, C-terminal [Dillenia turbinata]|uniref:Remorin, C-terminal n=1 Tax=Dillenia turbinata TaxID=194707 RepID=A0AAN8UTD1_9MAGN